MNRKHFKHAITHYLENVPDQVRGVKWLVLLIVIIGTAFAIAGLGRVKFDMTIEGWFENNDPTIVAMQEFRARFGSDDHLYIVYKPKDGDVFSAKSLETVRALRRDLLDRMLKAKKGSPLKHIVKITALDNAPILKAEDDALVSRNLVGPTIPTSEQELQEVIKTADGQRSLRLQYFSNDRQYGGILVETDFGTIPIDDEARASQDSSPGSIPNLEGLITGFDGNTEYKQIRFKPTNLVEYLDFMNEVKVSLNKPEFKDQFDFHPVGNSASTEYNLQTLQEMGTLYGVMLLIMMAVLWFLFRSFSGVLWPSMVVILSAVWTVGFFAWAGVPFTAFLILTVAMILVIGISDSIHILSGYEYFCSQGQDQRSAMRSAFRSSANACFLTAVTAMIGILSIVATPIVPMQVEGYTTATGIGLAFLFTIYLLPLMVNLWWTPKKTKERKGRRQRFIAFVGKYIPSMTAIVQKSLARVFPFVQKNKYSISGVALIALVICIYGTFQIRVDTDAKGMFPKNAQIRDDMDIADVNMQGSQVLEVYFDFGEEYALHDPYVLKRMDELQRTIESKYSEFVVKTISLVDVAKSSYQALNEDRPEMYVIPDIRQALANTFFMFDNSNPTDRRKMVSDDYSQAHISVHLRNAGSYEYTRIFDHMQTDIDAVIADLQQRYPQANASVTGMFTLIMQGSDYLSWNALSGFIMATIIITIALFLIFGSFKAGVVSVAANAVPTLLTFGLMGLLDVPLDFTTVLIAPIVIGLAVDDTIHFLTHYRHEVSIDGNVNRALIETIKEAGQSVTYTSLILILGLSVLGFSSSPGNANVGIFGALAVLLGWVCELLLTPSLILISGLTYKKKDAAPAEFPHEQFTS